MADYNGIIITKKQKIQSLDYIDSNNGFLFCNLVSSKAIKTTGLEYIDSSNGEIFFGISNKTRKITID